MDRFFQKPDEINGRFLEYKISYKTDGEAEKHRTEQGTTLTLGSLKKWTVYRIRVRVNNNEGLGPYSEKTVRTKEDGNVVVFVIIVALLLSLLLLLHYNTSFVHVV